MNLFRSEEHARNWNGYSEDAAGGMLSLADIMTIFSAGLFRERLSKTYISDLRDLFVDVAETARRVTKDNPFWMRQV